MRRSVSAGLGHLLQHCHLFRPQELPHVRPAFHALPVADFDEPVSIFQDLKPLAVMNSG
jgi:hypothetical protein